jgi:hypothetical protein
MLLFGTGFLFGLLFSFLLKIFLLIFQAPKMSSSLGPRGE